MQGRPSSPRLSPAPERRKSDRRNPKLASDAKRQRPYKAYKERGKQRNTNRGQGIASPRHERHLAEKKIAPRRSASRQRQREVNRMSRRTFPERQNRGTGYQKRQERMDLRPAPPQRPQQNIQRMPTARRAPDRAISGRNHRPQRGGQGWHPSTGRRHSAGATANRSRPGRHQAQRRY